MFIKKNKYIKSVLLGCLIIALTQLRISASDRPEVIFDEYLETRGVNVDKFADAIMNNEIDIENEYTVRFLETFSKYDLQLLRNTIYAKHGYIFKSNKIQKFFNNKPWYKPRNESIVLSNEEEKIISIIKKIENFDNVEFTEFYKLFIPIDLPVSYGEHTKSNRINRIYVRKYFNNENHYYWLSFYAIGKVYQDNKFMVLLYDIQSLETQPCIATFTLDGKLIANKSFFSIGGDIMSSTEGTLYIEKDLTIHVEIKEFKSNSIENIKSEKYFIGSDGIIKKAK